ncbi:RNA methyltransferase [Nocardioides sp. zg-579]|uniref:RNA methyltransferase n=1 Tax=Nocardioides marmotae TaxID=2663857 RepID=A0A6I3JHE9_9ACTN|nr:RNA methyltransferase [Nocardioides marmotae]MCR6033690.1 RNA methyltransferase [Gordonia jinghuaiqii]MTB97348.1 RNA methyltransferase [Nocardioides marmotae]QKE03515.1 RNA methyltransferase [Nocardioides marmotae]
MTTIPPLAASNTRVKDARRLSRRSVRSERRLFLADGPKAVEGALGRPGTVVEVFATVAATASYAALVAAAERAGVAWTLVEDKALASLSDSVTPAGVVALCRHLDRPLADLLAADRETRLAALCADVRDPGNAGTVVRCADAAGADLVVLAGSSVDAHNPKTVRASVGSLFHVPLAVEPDAASAVRAAQDAGLLVLAADGAGEVDLHAPEAEPLLARPTAWLFGNEAWGLPDELAALADHRVRIPIHGRAESLNLSTAAALCLYASARAHRA